MFIASAIHHHAAAINFCAILRRLQRNGHLDPTRKGHCAAKLNAVFMDGHGVRRKGQLRLPCLHGYVLLERTDAIDFSRTHIECYPRRNYHIAPRRQTESSSILTRLFGVERHEATTRTTNIKVRAAKMHFACLKNGTRVERTRPRKSVAACHLVATRPVLYCGKSGMLINGIIHIH